MKLTINNKTFKVIDAKEKITIADSFVIRQNKIGKGHGEAKLYVGQNNDFTRVFFGQKGFKVNCFLKKKDLIAYLEQTKAEYLNPEQSYNHKTELPNLWRLRKQMIDKLPDIIEFEVIEQTQIVGSRVYVNSSDNAYNLIRELSLPNITFISIIKLLNDKGKPCYYFRLFVDYFGETEHPYILSQEQQKIIKSDISKDDRLQLIRARVGQGIFRKKLLKESSICPITLVSDDRLLIASHIKPWVASSNFEKTDHKNGFLFTPTIDRLFDRGFLSFTNDKRTILSPFLSHETYLKLGLTNDKEIPLLPIEGRKEYLNYHRNTILKK